MAIDPALKNILFKAVVMEDKPSHSFVSIRKPKLVAIRFSLEPLRVNPMRIRREIETTADKLKLEVETNGSKNVDEIVGDCDSIYNDKISNK